MLYLSRDDAQIQQFFGGASIKLKWAGIYQLNTQAAFLIYTEHV